MFTCPGDRHDLSFVTFNPAVENTHLAGVEVAGIVRYFCAMHDNRGNL